MSEEKQTNTSDSELDVERKLIHLMLKHLDVVEEMSATDPEAEHFDPGHRPLVKCIYHEYIHSNRKRLLTRDAYRNEMIARQVDGNELMCSMDVYDHCRIGVHANYNDAGMLKSQLKDIYLARCLSRILDGLHQDIKKEGRFYAMSQAAEQMRIAVGTTENSRIRVSSIENLKTGFLAHLREAMTNKDKKITCDIPEIDCVVNEGFRPGGLTIFVAPPSGHKTNIKINIALNILDKGHSVLFVPLEMDSYELMERIVSNRARITADRMVSPNLLEESDLEKITQSEIWDKYAGKFDILDADERISVPVLRAEIEKRAAIMKPDLVIVDYVGILKPHVRYDSRNDLEIGEILKDLMFMGRKYGFHVITSAQMGRGDIRRIRDKGDAVVDTTAARGSQEYGADARAMFALLEVPNEPDKLKIVTLKARKGPKRNGELRVDVKHCRITSGTGIELSPGNPDVGFLSEQEPATSPAMASAPDIDGLFSGIETGEDTNQEPEQPNKDMF